MNISTFAVIGGDERYAILAQLLALDGHTVAAAGFDNGNRIADGVNYTTAAKAAASAENIILPLPPTTDGETVHAPLSAETIALDALGPTLSGKHVFTGFADKLVRARPGFAHLGLHDYSRREDFLMRNAYATAEALVMLAIQMLPTTLDESCVLITGFGRIGSCTAGMLSSLGARVFCATHSSGKLEQIAARGFIALTYNETAELAENFDLIINTADALVVDASLIRKLKMSAKIIDAASFPGGTDNDAAGYYGIESVTAPGLPGKYSPVTAAKAIRDAVMAIKEEEHI